jgi:hypothetical protein
MGDSGVANWRAACAARAHDARCVARGRLDALGLRGRGAQGKRRGRGSTAYAVHRGGAEASVRRGNARMTRGRRCPGARTTLWSATQRRWRLKSISRFSFRIYKTPKSVN